MFLLLLSSTSLTLLSLSIFPFHHPNPLLNARFIPKHTFQAIYFPLSPPPPSLLWVLLPFYSSFKYSFWSVLILSGSPCAAVGRRLPAYVRYSGRKKWNRPFVAKKLRKTLSVLPAFRLNFGPACKEGTSCQNISTSIVFCCHFHIYTFYYCLSHAPLWLRQLIAYFKSNVLEHTNR